MGVQTSDMFLQVLVLAKIIFASNVSGRISDEISNSEYNLAPEGRDSDECGFQLYGLAPGDVGSITTPNYPDGYPPSLRCIWWLKSLSTAKITIQCQDIHTQACDPENKVYDYALFSRDWTWEQYSIICGNNDEDLPYQIESIDNEISIFFRSSLKENGRGLNCSYSVVEKEILPSKLYNGYD